MPQNLTIAQPKCVCMYNTYVTVYLQNYALCNVYLLHHTIYIIITVGHLTFQINVAKYPTTLTSTL